VPLTLAELVDEERKPQPLEPQKPAAPPALAAPVQGPPAAAPSLAPAAPSPAAAPVAPEPASLASLVDEDRQAVKQDEDLDARFQAWKTTQANLPAEKGLAIRTVVQARPELDPQYVADNLEALQGELRQDRLERVLRDSPTLRGYFADPSRAAYVKDELDDASTWEWLFGRWKRVENPIDPYTGKPNPGQIAYDVDVAPAWWRAAKGGWAESVTIPRLAMKQLLGEAAPGDLEELERLEQAYQGRDYGAHNPLTRGVVGAPKMVPYIVGSTLFRLAGGALGAGIGGGGGAAAGAPVGGVGAAPGAVAGGLTGIAVGQYAGGAAFDFLEQVGPMYRSLSMLRRADGEPLLSDAEAKSYAVGGSLALAGLTSGIAGKVVERFPIVKQVLERAAVQSVEKALVEQGAGRLALQQLRRYGEHVALGGAMMAVQGSGTAAIGELAKASHGADASWQPVFDAAVHGFTAGIQDMSLLAAWGPGREFLREQGRMAATEHARLQYEAIGAHAEASPLLEKDRAAAEDLFGHVALAQGAPRVLVDPLAWDAYWQGKKVDPRAMAVALGDENAAMYDHVKAGVMPDLSFPVEKWTARLGKTEHLLALGADVKFQGELRTPRQQAEWVKAQEKLAKKLGGAARTTDDRQEQLDGLEHAKYLELLAAKRNELDAQSVARLFRDALDHFSRTENLTPAEVLARHPLRFQGPEKTGKPLSLSLKPPKPTTAAAVAPAARPATPAPEQGKLAIAPQERSVVAPEGPAEGRVLTEAAAPVPPAPARPEAPLPEGFAEGLPDAVRAAILDSFRGDQVALRAMSQKAKTALEGLARAGFTDGLVPELGNQKAHEAFMATDQAKGGVHVITDMPGLKARNDKLGQAAGDAALRAYGRAFSASSRAAGGKAHRMSTGDEFFAWFPDQAAADAFLRDFPARLAGPDGTLRPGDQLSTYAGVGTSKDQALAQLVRAKAAAKAKYGDSRAGGAVGHGETFVFRHGDAQEAPAGAPGGRELGAATSVVTPQRPQGEPARYAVLEASELIPSHLPDSFQPDPRYPAGVQEREYHRQKEEQTKVVQGAQRLNPALVLSDTPSAVDGPPLVTSGARALVMGGNGRAMMLARAMREPATAQRYRAALLEKAGGFGLDRAKIEGMREPVLVRVLEGVGADAPHDELVAAVRRTNEGMTQALSPRARAVAEAKNLSPETVQGIGRLLTDAGDATLRDVMRDSPQALVELLRRDGVISQQNQAAWLAGGLLTDEAKERIEGMFLGRVLGSGDRMAATAPAMLQKLERVAPALLRVQGVNPAMDEVPTIQAALDLVNDARRRELKLEELLAQGSLFGSSDVLPAVANMARLLDKAKPKELASRFDAWAAEAAFDPRQATMFAPNPTPEQARAALFQDRDVRATLFQPERPEPKELKNLVVQHNLTVENLEHADELGALVAPSLGVSRTEHPLTAFGEITLLGPTSLVDPAGGTKVFPADVYSPRHPRPVHEVLRKPFDKLVAWLKPYAKRVGGDAYGLSDELQNGAARAVERRENRMAFGLAYLEEVKGVKVPDRTREAASRVSERELFNEPGVSALRDFFKREGRKVNEELGSEYHRKLSEATREAVEQYVGKFDEADRAEIRKGFLERDGEGFMARSELFDEKTGLLTANKFDALVRDAEKLGKVEPDPYAMQDDVKEALANAGIDDAELEAWAREKVQPTIGAAKLRIYSESTGNVRKVPYTVDNILRVMKRDALQGGEKSMGGLGSVRAKLVKPFRSLEAVQRDRNLIVTPDEFKLLREELDAQYGNLADEITPYYTGGKDNAFRVLDLLAEAIGESGRRGRTLEKELRSSLFEGVPVDLVKRIGVFREQLAALPTEYFEAKPLRPVDLSEFKVAVVSKRSEARARPLLEKHGLRVEVFDDGGEDAPRGMIGTSRHEAIAAAAEKYGLLFQGKRGEIRFQVDPKGDVAAFDVTLLEGADESTAAHELGHWMGLVLGQLASRPEASEINRELYAVALKTMGYADHSERQRALLEAQELRTKDARAAAGQGEKLDAGELERLKAIEAKEEQLSHAFEAYLAEGRAPTASLGRVFSRFKLWMVRLYRGLEGIRETYRQQYGQELNLSDDVRRMFDRILGADEAIREAGLDRDAAKIEEAVRALPEQDQGEIRAALEAARTATEEELQRVLVAEDLRERRVFMANERERLREEVAKELDAQPGYQASRFLREGRMPEGRTVPPELVTETGEPRMIDRTEAVARYGAEFVRENLRGLTTRDPKKAAPADLVAEAFGFATGDELVRELAKLPSRGEVIRTRVQERLEEKYGAALLENPEKLGEAALAAAHSPEQARAILTGMRILARRLSPDLDPRFRAVDLVAIERRAREFTETQAIAEVSPARALIQERRSALAAIELLAKAAKEKDEGTRRQLAAEAFDAHELQLFNHYVWKAARDVREQAEKDVGHLRKYLGDRERAKLGKAGADYLERVDDLLGSIELRSSRSMAEVERRREILYAARDPAEPGGYNPQAAAAMVAWLEQQKALNRDPFVPDRVIENLKKIRHWRELSGEELGELRDTVQSIAHLAHVKDTLLAGKDRRERKAIMGELTQRLFETFGEQGIVVDRNTLAFKKRALKAVARLKAGIIRPEEFFREADGGQLDGPFTKYLWNPINDSVHRWSDLAEKVQKPVVAELEKMPMEDKLRWRHLRFTVKGQPYTMEAALAVALNWGNLSNRSKLVRGWQYGGLEKFGLQAWDGEATAHEFLRHLTAKDWELVQRVWNQLESLRPEMEQLEKRFTGLTPKWIKPEVFEVQTSDGQLVKLEGGYYPMVYDRRFSHAGAGQAEAAEQGNFQLFQQGYERGITPHGHLNARIEEFARPVELSLIGLYRHLSHATKDVAMREALVSVYEIVTDSNFRAAIQRTAGEEVLPLLDKWVRDTANDLVVPEGGEGLWLQIVNGTRRGITGSVFAFNAAQALQNLTGIVNVQSRVDARYLWKGIDRLRAERGAMVEWIHRQSGEMRHASRNLDRDIREGLERSLGKRGVLHRSKEVAMWAFQASDAVVRYAAWLGAYYQALDGKVEGVKVDQKSAVRWADQTVRLALTANATKDLPALMRSPHARWFTLFYGWASSRLNDVIGATADAKREAKDGSYGRAMRRLTRVMFYVMAGAVLSDLAVGKGAQDDDEDGTVDGADWSRWMARRAALAPFSLIPLAGPIVRAAVDGRRDVSLAPVERVYSGVAQTLSSGWAAGSAILEGDPFADELAHFGGSLAETAGMAAGLPVNQTKATLGYWMDEGRDPGDSLGEQALGTLYGKKRSGSLAGALYGE
jgi:GGDEF domain-containing protein